MKKLIVILCLCFFTAMQLTGTPLKKATIAGNWYYTSVGDTGDYNIILDYNTRFWDGDTIFYQLNVDEDTLSNAEYLMDGLMPTGNNGLFASGAPTRGYYPIQPVIDLGGYYKISAIKIFDYFGTDTLNVAYGTPFHWSDTVSFYENAANTWKTISTSFYTRYIKVFYSNANGTYQKVKELNLTGHLVGDSLTRTEPTVAAIKPDFTMGQFIGFNQIGPEQVDSVGALMRHYLQMNWIDTVTTTHNVDSIKFVFSIFGHPTNNTDATSTVENYFFPGSPLNSQVTSGQDLSNADMHRMALGGEGYFDAFKTTELPTYAGNQGKPIDTVEHPDPDPTNPDVYDRLSRMAWMYTAFYGFKTHPADSMQTPYPTVSGLGLRAIVESGNEMNMNWGSIDQYFSPKADIAYNSAFYDGNLGQMGPRMGAKNADSSMFILHAGTAGGDINYLKNLHYYSYYERKDHSAPFDGLNFHEYPTDGVNGANSGPYAVSPEEYIYPDNSAIKQYVNTARLNFPGKPIWLTEWGYDRNRKSSIAVPPIMGKDSAQIQADWIARFWFLLSFTGIDRSTIFQLHNDAMSTMFDSAFVLKFNTMGLVDGHYVADTYSPGTYAHSYYAFPAYYYQRAIWLQLYNYKPDSIIYENHDSIWVYRYKNIANDSIAYAIWSGTQTNRSIDSFAIKTGHPNTAAGIVLLEDKQMTGAKSNYTANSDGEIPVVINETPKLIFTTSGTDGGQLVNYTAPVVSTQPKLLLYLFDGKLISTQ